MSKRQPTAPLGASMAASSKATDAAPPLQLSSVAFQAAIHLIFVVALFSHPITIPTLLLTAVFYALTAFALSAGYHRLYTHGSFSAIAPFRAFVLLFGGSACMGSIYDWALLHRAHHQFIDSEKDPFSIKQGFLHAHIGWRLHDLSRLRKRLREEVDMTDIEKDSLARFLSFPIIYVFVSLGFGFLLPALLSGYYFDDFWGGMLFAGIGRVVLIQHAFNSIQSVGHTIGVQSYSDKHSAHSFYWLSFFTMGEGDQNFHHEFCTDYRISHTLHDPTKIILKLLSVCNVTYSLHKARRVDIKSRLLNHRQELADRKRAGLNFGPEEETLPYTTWQKVDERMTQGAKLVVIDGLVHDVEHFISEHPGGIKILRGRLGKDATLAFNGALYCHSKSARNILSTFRVARLVKEDIESRVKKDHFRNEDE